MSCCNFSGVDNSGYNLDPEAERVTEAIYSDWTEAAGGGVRPYFPPLMDRRADDGFNPNPPITTTSGRTADSPWVPMWDMAWKKAPTVGTGPTNPNPVPMDRRTDRGPAPDPLSGWKKGTTIGTGPTNPNPVPMDMRGDYNPDVPIVNSGRMTQQPCEGGGDCPPGQSCVGGRCAITTRTMRPSKYYGRGRLNFDGAAVKQNWVPLVVLGLSLVVGIAISEYGFKKIVK